MITDTAFPKLKVFHFISGDLWAGAETMAFNLLRRLKEYDDLDISVILLNEGRLADEIRCLGLAVHVIDENQHSFLEILQRIYKIASNTAPHIIHSHRYKENILAFLISLRLRGIKLISTLHGLTELPATKSFTGIHFKSKVNYLLLSRFFLTVAVSINIRNFLINSHSFSPIKIEVIHNGIDLTGQAPQRKETVPFVIGSSGRLFPVKDYPLMVEIARLVAATTAKDVRFELAGDGPERSTLEALIQSYNLSAGFSLKGHQEDMDSFYCGLNVYLNTSLHEGIPMTILEAMSHGLPVIAPAVGGLVEIIDDGIDGFLIDSRNPQEFADKCILLNEDMELLDKMKQAAIEKAKKSFSAEGMAESYYQHYRRLVD